MHLQTSPNPKSGLRKVIWSQLFAQYHEEFSLHSVIPPLFRNHRFIYGFLHLYFCSYYLSRMFFFSLFQYNNMHRTCNPILASSLPYRGHRIFPPCSNTIPPPRNMIPPYLPCNITKVQSNHHYIKEVKNTSSILKAN